MEMPDHAVYTLGGLPIDTALGTALDIEQGCSCVLPAQPKAHQIGFFCLGSLGLKAEL